MTIADSKNKQNSAKKYFQEIVINDVQNKQLAAPSLPQQEITATPQFN